MVISMKLVKLLPILLLVSLLSGCFGKEPNDMAYIVAIGVDEIEGNDNYKITIQFARPTQISGGASEEGGKGGAGIIENISVEAPDLYSGIGIANTAVSKKFSLSHAKLIVFSKEIAEKGIEDIIDTLVRSDEARPDMYYAVALEGANNYLTEVKPVIELNPAKYYQLVYEKNNAGAIPQNTTENLYFEKNNSEIGSVMALAGVIDMGDSGQSGEESSSGGDSEEKPSEELSKENEKQKNAPLNEDGFEYRTRDYIAGEVSISKKNKSETIGLAVFKNYKMVGILKSIDAEIYNMLSGLYKDSYTSFYSKESPESPVTLKVNQERKPEIKVDIKNQTVNITIFLEADLYSLSAEYILENNMGNFEAEVSQEISKECVEFIKKAREEYDLDLLGIGNKAKMHFLTYRDFDDYKWGDKFKEYEINVDTKFKIRRTGLILRESKE